MLKYGGENEASWLWPGIDGRAIADGAGRRVEGGRLHRDLSGEDQRDQGRSQATGAGDRLLGQRRRSGGDTAGLLGTVADKGAGFRSLRDSWADTTTPHGRLMLTVLGGLAEFERELIRSRTGEGRQRAKARGVVMGRKPKLTRHQQQEAIARRDAGEALVDIGRSYNVSHSTISRL